MEESLAQKFLSISSKEDLAEILGVKYSVLVFNLYKLSDEEKYIEFKIKKRTKGTRTIIAPNSGIKFIQKNLSNVLLEIYPNKKCVHGYVKKKGIKTNAIAHVNKKTLINIDLKDFFPSINFGRVMGLFKSYPFNFSDTIAVTIAQICCYKGFLPQGAPTSPIISNLICRRLDNELIDLSIKGRFIYTRYADDITFSTNILPIPAELGEIKEYKLSLSTEIKRIIKENGFGINQSKTRYATRYNRQEVTGLVVNQFPNVKRNYVRHVRAMLHSWEKYGINNAAKEHFEKYNYKNKKPGQIELSFQYELVGKIGYIGMIRGKDDKIYKKLYYRIKKLNPQVKLSIVQKESELSGLPIVYGEGKTDWKHLLAALRKFQTNGEFLDLEIYIKQYNETFEMNNSELLKVCQSISKINEHKTKIICLFDRDDKKYVKVASEDGMNFKHWGNNVYSALLPIPKHRDFDEICIEHFYYDTDLLKTDSNGRRLFLSTEFAQDTGRHATEDLTYVNKSSLRAKHPRIIDNKVFSANGSNVALAKNSFADYILNQEAPFDNVNIENFRDIFVLFKTISKHNAS